MCQHVSKSTTTHSHTLVSTTAVSTAITVATISTYVVAGVVALFGASDAIETFSGGINPIRDYVMGGNQTAYK